MEQKIFDWPQSSGSNIITNLEQEIKEQKLLRLQDAKQVEVKLCKIVSIDELGLGCYVKSIKSK